MFTKHLYTTIIILAITLNNFCQNKYYLNKENKKFWSEDVLSWDDFSENSHIGIFSELKYYMGYRPILRRLHDTTFQFTEVYLYMDRKLSWVHPLLKNKYTLRYHQITFDILELFRRKIQYEFLKTSFVYYDAVFKDQITICENYINEFRNDVQMGIDTLQLNIWEEKIHKELQNYPSNLLSIMKENPGKFGVYIGFGKSSTTNNLNKYLGDGTSFTMMVDYSYKKILMNASLITNSYRLHQLLVGSKLNYPPRTGANINLYSLNIGYNIYEGKKVRIYPYIGAAHITFATRIARLNRSNYTLSQVDVVGGIFIDIKWIKQMSFLQKNYYYTSPNMSGSYFALVTRLSISSSAPIQFSNELKGSVINFNIMIGWDSKKLKLKKILQNNTTY